MTAHIKLSLGKRKACILEQMCAQSAQGTSAPPPIRRPEEFDRLAVFAHQAAIAIKNAHLFAEVEALKTRLQAENIYLQEEIGLRCEHLEMRGLEGGVEPYVAW
jgi:hypothetical protein